VSPSVWRGWADALEQPRAGPAEGVNKPVAGMQQEAAVPAAEPREAPLERGRLPLFPAHLGTPLAAARCEALQVACPTHAHSRADGSCHAQVLPEDWAEFDEEMRGKKAGPEPSAPPPLLPSFWPCAGLSDIAELITSSHKRNRPSQSRRSARAQPKTFIVKPDGGAQGAGIFLVRAGQVTYTTALILGFLIHRISFLIPQGVLNLP